MRRADTETLLALNDRAKVANLNQWLTARFFEDVDWDGRHILAIAFPHGERPGAKRIADQPPHFRTLWYAQMRNGSTQRVLIDVQSEDLAALPEIAGTPNDAVLASIDVSELPAVVLLDDGYVIDGRHAIEAARLRGEDAVGGLQLTAPSDEEIARVRDLLQNED
jgi:hypothetical protein